MTETDDNAMYSIELLHTPPRTATDLQNGVRHVMQLAESYALLASLTAKQEELRDRIISLRKVIAKTQQHVIEYYLIDEEGRPTTIKDIVHSEEVEE